MTKALDIHLATDDERRQAHANCHDAWSQGLPLSEHIARRENSALHARARWIVGCLDGRVVAGLASHPLEFRLSGRILAGMGIASVHTLAEFRGRGFAQRMLDWIERFEAQRGALLSVLFCDIHPEFYERFGYTLCPSHVGWAAVDAADAGAITEPEAGRGIGQEDAWRLVSGKRMRDELPRLAALYDSDHGQRPLAIERSVDYWRHLADRRPDAELFWLTSVENRHDGYAVLRRTGEELRIDDHAVRGGDELARAGLFRRVIELASNRGLKRAGGGVANAAPANAAFAIEPRPDEVTMFKPLAASVVLSPAAIRATDWLQEIDHV